ncbi:hypothetical protein Tco_0833451 [Tanacetum coccineum]
MLSTVYANSISLQYCTGIHDPPAHIIFTYNCFALNLVYLVIHYELVEIHAWSSVVTLCSVDDLLFSLTSLHIVDSSRRIIPDKMCDVPFHDNSPPLDISKDQFEGFSDSNDDSTSIDDDSFSIDDIDYVDASPPDSELKA